VVYTKVQQVSLRLAAVEFNVWNILATAHTFVPEPSFYEAEMVIEQEYTNLLKYMSI
jgi:hypothetical protein